jgi:predicted DNA-binding transcriptional regulator AlpA
MGFPCKGKRLIHGGFNSFAPNRIGTNGKPHRHKRNTMTELQILDTEEAAKIVRHTPATLRYWRHMGQGPKSFKMGGHKVYYLREDVDAWVTEQYAASNPPIHSVA